MNELKKYKLMENLAGHINQLCTKTTFFSSLLYILFFTVLIQGWIAQIIILVFSAICLIYITLRLQILVYFTKLYLENFVLSLDIYGLEMDQQIFGQTVIMAAIRNSMEDDTTIIKLFKPLYIHGEYIKFIITSSAFDMTLINEEPVFMKEEYINGLRVDVYPKRIVLQINRERAELDKYLNSNILFCDLVLTGRQQERRHEFGIRRTFWISFQLKKEPEYYEEKFSFIYDNIFLTARVNKKSGRQELVMTEEDKNGKVIRKEAIECIHTVITKIPYEKFAERIQEDNFEQEMMNIRSSEDLQEIHLSPREKFKALKSWVAGIAEAGYECFSFHNDALQELAGPLLYNLVRFCILYDDKLLSEYLLWVEKKCRFENSRHEASLIANLRPILELGNEHARFFRISDITGQNFSEKFRYIEQILELDPPFSLFMDTFESIDILTMYITANIMIYADQKFIGKKNLHYLKTFSSISYNKYKRIMTGFYFGIIHNKPDKKTYAQLYYEKFWKRFDKRVLPGSIKRLLKLED